MRYETRLALMKHVALARQKRSFLERAERVNPKRTLIDGLRMARSGTSGLSLLAQPLKRSRLLLRQWRWSLE